MLSTHSYVVIAGKRFPGQQSDVLGVSNHCRKIGRFGSRSHFVPHRSDCDVEYEGRAWRKAS